jgi:predicted metal-binding membrane protein
LAQAVLLWGTLITTGLAAASGIFGGAVLIAAGLYQWTPMKDACLSQCQAPLQFVQSHGGFNPRAVR